MDGRVDMHRIDLGVLNQLLEALVAHADAVLIAEFLQLFPGALAKGIHNGIGMALVNGNKLLAEAQADDRDIQFAACHEFP